VFVRPTAADPGFAKEGGPWRAYDGGPQRGPGAEQGGSAGAKLPEAESSWSIFIQTWGQNMAKVEDLNDNSSPCLRQTSRSYD